MKLVKIPTRKLELFTDKRKNALQYKRALLKALKQSPKNNPFSVVFFRLDVVYKKEILGKAYWVGVVPK